MLDGTSLAGAPCIAVSSVDGDGIDGGPRGARATSRSRSDRAGRRADRPAGSRLAIDRVFAVKGRGAVVTGTLRGGTLDRGATLRLVPGDRSVRVREVQVHGSDGGYGAGPGRSGAQPGRRRCRRPASGAVLTDDPAVVASDRLLVRLDVDAARPSASEAPPRHGGGGCGGRAERPGRARPRGRQRRRDPAAGGVPRDRTGRPVRPAARELAAIGSSAGWSSMPRRRAACPAGARPPSGSGAWPWRSQAGERDRRRRRRLDLHGISSPRVRDRRPGTGRRRHRRERRGDARSRSHMRGRSDARRRPDRGRAGAAPGRDQRTARPRPQPPRS